MKEVKIIVTGECGSGKSRIAYLIKKTLREAGVNVEFESDMDYPNEEAFDRAMENKFDQCISGIKETRKITIKTMQANRAPSENN